MVSSVIREFERDSEEYQKLERLAMCLTLKSPNGFRYRVGVTYFDYGQNWKWTTVLCDNGDAWGGYQALNPREQDEILFSDGSFEDVCRIADGVLSDKFCPDKVRDGIASKR